MFSRSFVYNSLQPHGLQHAKLPCPSLNLNISHNMQNQLKWIIDKYET